MAEKCKVELHIMRGDSPWKEFTRSFEEEKAGKHIAAAVIDASCEKPAHLERYAATGEPLLAIDRAKRRVVVNNAYFSDIERADATRFSKGNTVVIGTFKDTAFKSMSPEKLVLFLLESQIIETYWHLESRLCLISETDTESVYVAGFKGVHVYYTNSRNEDAFSFSVAVEKKTGLITLSGR